MKEFKSFFKEVKGNEGNKCRYNVRLDTFGCGCQHDCAYCYAKSLLNFRGLWNAKEPSTASLAKIECKIAKLPKGTIVRLGGMTDCFQAQERRDRVTRGTILLLNKYRIGYLIVTKSDLICEYADILDKQLAHIQVSITFAPCEKAVSTERRIRAVEMLQEQLKEENSYPGALICEYDFFRVLYYSTARSVLRSGWAVHLALISVKGKKVSEHDSKRWEKIQTNLQDTIRSSMRRGDSAARCSASQYVIMLPRANYENSCMVCDRIIKAYYQKHSRLDVDIRYEVFPIQPDEKENFAWRKEPTEE
jgi:hypothetical protein